MKVTYDIFIARFPYHRIEDYEVSSFIARTICAMKADQRIGTIHNKPYNDTPITMIRNKAIKDARSVKADIMLFIDNDMVPDCCLDTPDRQALYHHLHPEPFWPSSFEFLIEHNGPCVVAAPYCGPPPVENIYVFHWDNLRSNDPNPDVRLSQYSRHEAAQRSGFEEVCALPTGLMLIDLRIFDNKRFKPPYFKYEYIDAEETEKGTTEDCFFTRNATMAGTKLFCNWNSWAGHVKPLVVGPPRLLTPDSVREQYKEAVAANNLDSNQSLMFFKSKGA